MIPSLSFTQTDEYRALEEQLNTTKGEERIRILYKLANQDINNDQALCRQRGWEMVDSAEVYGLDELIGWGYRYVGLIGEKVRKS